MADRLNATIKGIHMLHFVKSIFTKTIGGLHEAALVLAGFAVMSQVLGLVRDRLLAHSFGASQALDMYYAAFRIPDFLFVTVASLVSLFVLVPFVTEKLGEGKDVAQRFLSQITTAFFIVIVVISALVFIFVPKLIHILFPGFTDNAVQEEVIMLTRILLLSPILLGCSNILSSVTHVFKRFYVYALSPIFYNVGIILGIVFLYPVFGLSGLAYGVVLGGLLHLGIQVPSIVREGLVPHVTFTVDFREVWKVVKVSLPRTIALAGSQTALFVLIALASTLPEGSIALFTFAFNLQSAPLAIIGVSYSVAAFPTLSKLFLTGKHEEFRNQMVQALQQILFWSVPIMVVVIVLREQIVQVVLGSGAFDASDVRLTALALAIFVISLAAQSLMLLFVRGYYARGETVRPLVVNTLSSLSIILIALLGMWMFKAEQGIVQVLADFVRAGDVESVAVLILPCSYMIGMVFNAVVFWFLFKRDFGQAFPRTVYTTLMQSLFASLLGGCAAYGGLHLFGQFFNLETLWGVFFQGALAGVLGMCVWVAFLCVLKNKEMQDLMRQVRHLVLQRYTQ